MQCAVASLELMQWCRVMVHAALGTNLALGQPTNQSSTQFGGSSDLAVDGNIDGFYSSGSVTHTGGTLEYAVVLLGQSCALVMQGCWA